MTSFDPYALLGLSRSATPAAVKAAYRQRVQTSHPDRGGDAAVFIALVKAFGLLSDPAARKLYDETGTVDDDGVTNFRRDVTVILADMFDAAVASAVATGLRLTSVDFVAQMTVAVKTGAAEARGLRNTSPICNGALHACWKTEAIPKMPSTCYIRRVIGITPRA